MTGWGFTWEKATCLHINVVFPSLSVNIYHLRCDSFGWDWEYSECPENGFSSMP